MSRAALQTTFNGTHIGDGSQLTNLNIAGITNFPVGLATTNFVLTQISATNFANLNTTTNLVYSIGANGTNFGYLIGANGTNFTYFIGANLTNYVNTATNGHVTASITNGLATTALVYSIGANVTNYVNSATNSLAAPALVGTIPLASLPVGFTTNNNGGALTNLNVVGSGAITNVDNKTYTNIALQGTSSFNAKNVTTTKIISTAGFNLGGENLPGSGTIAAAVIFAGGDSTNGTITTTNSAKGFEIESWTYDASIRYCAFSQSSPSLGYNKVGIGTSFLGAPAPNYISFSTTNGSWTIDSFNTAGLDIGALIPSSKQNIGRSTQPVGTVYATNFTATDIGTGFIGNGAGLTNLSLPYTSITNSPWITTNALTSLIASSNFVTASVTNGLATTAYVNGATNGLVTSSVTNGLANTNFVLTQISATNTANLIITTNYVNSVTNGLVTASVTNGLATTAFVYGIGANDTNYVNTATNGLVTVSVTNGLATTAFVYTIGANTTNYVNAATNNLVTASVTNGLATTGYVTSQGYIVNNPGSLIWTNNNGIYGNGVGLTNIISTNIVAQAGVLAPASAVTNYTINLLSGELGNIQQVYLANANCYITFSGTNVADTMRSVLFRGWTNTVVSTLAFVLPSWHTNYTVANYYVTNGQAAIFNFYNPDTSGTNVMVSDGGRWK